jgi:hypothetical protein
MMYHGILLFSILSSIDFSTLVPGSVPHSVLSSLESASTSATGKALATGTGTVAGTGKEDPNLKPPVVLVLLNIKPLDEPDATLVLVPFVPKLKPLPPLLLLPLPTNGAGAPVTLPKLKLPTEDAPANFCCYLTLMPRPHGLTRNTLCHI